MRNPAYLTLSEQNIYHFRWPIPKHLLGNGKRRYCKLSLGTREPDVALQLGRILASRAAVLASSGELQGMDYIELKQMLQTYLQRTLAAAKEDMEWRGGEFQSRNITKLAIENPEGAWDFLVKEGGMDDYLKHVCKVMDAPEIVGQEPEWGWLKECFHKMYPQFAKAMLDAHDKLNSFDFDNVPDVIEATATALPSINYTLQFVIDKYVAAHASDAAWDENTREGKEAILAILRELLGAEMNIAAIDSKVARSVRDDIKRIPKNRKKNPRVRHLPLREAMDLPDVDCITGVTVGKYFNTIRGLFDWCVSEEYVARNPFATLKISVERKRKKSDRVAYSPEQIRKIQEAIKDERIHYRRWGTLLGIYSGARLNEISQLELDDIQQKEGIWYFNMNDEGDDKRLKTAAAKRLVPIHNELLILGILEERERL